jgi:hypothetical protein
MHTSHQYSNDTLRIYGNLSLLEMAPVLLAADRIYPEKTLLEHGSVMALWGQASDLASLTSAGQADLATNSETQALRGSVAHPDLRSSTPSPSARTASWPAARRVLPGSPTCAASAWAPSLSRRGSFSWTRCCAPWA